MAGEQGFISGGNNRTANYISDYMSKSEPGSFDNEITLILQRTKAEGSSGKSEAIQNVEQLLEAKRNVNPRGYFSLTSSDVDYPVAK